MSNTESKTTDPNTIPSAYQARDEYQALAHIIEECGEVIAAAGKTYRFGPDSYNPELPPEEREKNIDWVLREIRDLKRAIRAWEEMRVQKIMGAGL